MQQPNSRSEQIAALIRAGHSPSKAIAMCSGGAMPGYADGGTVTFPDGTPTPAQVEAEIAAEKARMDAIYAAHKGAATKMLMPPRPDGFEQLGEEIAPPAPTGMAGSAPGLVPSAAKASDDYYNSFAQGGSVKPQAMASGGEMSEADLATLKDMFGTNSSALDSALTDARGQALQQTMQDVPLSNYLKPLLANKSAAESAEVLSPPPPNLPVPTQGEAGAQLVGPSYGGQPAVVADSSGAATSAEGASNLPAVQSNLPAVQGGPIQAAARGAGDDAIETTGRVLGQEALPLAGSLASKAVLPASLAYEFLKSTPAGEGEDELMKAKLQKWAAETGNPVPSLAADAPKDAGTDKVPPPSRPAVMSDEAYGPPSPAAKTAALLAAAKRGPATAPAPGGQNLPPPAASAPPQAAARTMDPLLAKYLQDRQDMKDAQDQASQNRLSAGLAGALGQIGASTYGSTKPVNEAAFKQLQENANAPVANQQALQAAGMKSIEEQTALTKARAEQEANDPNSAMSNTLRKVYGPMLAKAGLPTDGLSVMGAADIKAYAADPLNHMEKMKEAEARLAEQREMAQQRLMYQRGQIDDKEAPTIAKGLNYLTASSRSALGSAANAKTSTARLAQIASDPNATPQDMENVYADLNRVVSNTTTMSGTEHQAYHNLNTQLAKAIGYITSNPTAADIPQVKQHILDVARGMDKISDDVINRNTKIVQSGHQGWISRHQDQWQSMVDAAAASPGAAPAAAAPGATPSTGPHGQTVIQGGHTYTWNPQTQKYE